MSELEHRKLFFRQPARVVLVDFRPPMDGGTCLNMLQALTDTLMLAHHLTGPSRVPLFSLIALGLYPEALYPLQPVTGNQARLLGALRELKNMCTTSLPSSSTSCLAEGIDEALMQMRRQQMMNASGVNASGQLEITIVTGVGSSIVHRQLSSLSNCPTLECVKRIQVLCVHDGERMMSEHDDDGSLMNEQCLSELLTGLLDILPIENDVLSFQSVFHCWLHDCNMDSEHLSLSLPPSGSVDDNTSVRITLKCDLYERVLDPTLLPGVTNHFVGVIMCVVMLLIIEHTLLTATTAVEGEANKHSLLRGHNDKVAVHQLRAVGLISSSGVCESVLYGMPLIMMPTACWKLDWEELETNSDNFYALCQLLREKELLVLACEVTPAPVGYYLILPSPSYSLLIKSVAISELLLPVEINQQLECPPDNAIHNVKECLEKLEVIKSYNPLLVSSQLSSVLASIPANKRTNSSGVKAAVKRKYQPPPMVQPHVQQPATVKGTRRLTTPSSTRRGKNVSYATSNEPHPHSSSVRKGYAPLDSTLK